MSAEIGKVLRAVALLAALWVLMAGTARAALPDGPNGPVIALAQGADGTTYIGGRFTSWSPRTGNGAALDSATGQVNRDFPAVEGSVYAVAEDGAGGWYIGGTFTAVGGLPRNGLAQIDNAGRVTNWDPQIDRNGEIYAIVVSNDQVFVGGYFGVGTFGLIRRGNLVAFGRDGSVSTWKSGANYKVFALAANNGVLYAGGWFTSMGGLPRYKLAAFGPDGNLLPDWYPDANGNVYALAASGNTVYVGGEFSWVNGEPRDRVAALRADGRGAATAWNPGADARVNALKVVGDTVYVGGNFKTIGGQARNGVAAIGPDGRATTWNPDLSYASNVGSSAYVLALAASGNSIYIAGSFSTVGGQLRSCLAVFDANGTLLNWNPAPQGLIRALATDGATVYAGGEFKFVGGVPRSGLAAIGPDGGLTDWVPDIPGTLNGIGNLAIDGNKVYAAGGYVDSTNRSRAFVAAFGADAAVLGWYPIDWGLCPPITTTLVSEWSQALAVRGGSMLFGGGNLGFGCPMTALKSIDAEGTVVEPWRFSSYGLISALAIRSGKLYVGGSFSTVDGETRNGLAAIDADGTLSEWAPATEPYSRVNAITFRGDILVVGGTFKSLAGQPRANLAAFDTSGVLLPWSPQANGSVTTLASNGRTVYVGAERYIGLHEGMGYSLEAFDDSGSKISWTATPNGVISSLLVSGGNLLVGGSFTGIDGDLQPGSSTSYLARLKLISNPTSMRLTGPPGPTYYGTAVTLVAQVDPVPAGGSIAFTDHGQVIPSCRAKPVDTVSGTASCHAGAIAVGEHVLSASFSGYADDQASSSAVLSLRVLPAEQSIVFMPIPLLIVEGSAALNASASSGLTVRFTSLSPGVCAIGANGVVGLNPGVCTVAADQDGDATYLAAARVTQRVTVMAAALDTTQIVGMAGENSARAAVEAGWTFAPAGDGARQTSGFIPLRGHAKSPPNAPVAVQFPYGLLNFVGINGAVGSTMTVTITYPAALPANTKYWMFGRTADDATPHWYVFPSAVIRDNTITLGLVDGGAGDDDLSADGVIVDPGGPGIDPAWVPALDVRALVTLSTLVLLSALIALRRRRS